MIDSMQRRCPLRYAPLLVVFAGSYFAAAQDCMSSLKVIQDKQVLISPWDGSQNTTIMSCSEAETVREKVFIDQLRFLSNTQLNSAAQINQVISDSVTQLDQLRLKLRAANTDEIAVGLSATLDTVKWQIVKTKLLLCALKGGKPAIAIAACAPQLFAFIKASAKAFKTFHSASEAHKDAEEMQNLLTQLRIEISQLGAAHIEGSTTAQRYAAVFQSYCTQIKKDCM